MSNQTMVFSSTSRRSEKWRVYRIRTANSVYELEVQTPTAEGRRCVVLTCVEPKERAGQQFEDSAPRASGADLHALSPLEWMGKTLEVGTAVTSEIQSVDFIATAEARRARTLFTGAFQPGHQPHPRRAAPATVQAQQGPSWGPFPASHVEMAETAATLLKMVLHRHDLEAALAADAKLRQRLTLALEQCRLMLDSLPRG